jgi:predicted Zn-dependent protease
MNQRLNIIGLLIALCATLPLTDELVMAADNSHAGAATRAAATASQPTMTAAQLAQEIDKLRAKVESEPGDAKLRYNLAEYLKKAGRNKEAARQYLQVTESEPSFYHAYHQLTLTTQDKHILDEAQGRLTFLMEEKPKDLLLRVALSEIYERKGDFFQAGKVLVDLVYQNAVPDKYLTKVSNRIRLMQAKAKDSHALDKVSNFDEQMETAPPPLPESTLNRDLSISKVKEPRVMQGFGHATLLP